MKLIISSLLDFKCGRNFIKVLFLLLLVGFSVNAQDTLTYEQAISLALQDNYSVRVARNNVHVRQNMASPGMAGLLPTLGASGSANYSNRDTRVLISPEQPVIEAPSAVSTTIQGQVGVNYLLFDGLGNVYTFQSLKAQHGLSETEARMTLENTIVQVSNAFYNLALLQDNYQTALEALEISRERYRRQATRSDYGRAVSSEVLTARVDLNQDTVALITLQNEIDNAKRNINSILSRDVNIDFAIQTDVQFREGLSYDQLLNNALEQNADIVAARQNQTIARLDHKIAQSAYFPTLSVSAGYGYTRTDNQAGVPLFIRALGLNAGATLSYSIFDGNRRRIQQQNAMINLQSSEMVAEQELLNTQRDFQNTWNNYQTALTVLDTERENLSAAEANFQRNRELFNLGQITNTQFREAQLNLIRSKFSISNALYSAKLAEVEILRISGQLLQNSGE